MERMLPGDGQLRPRIQRTHWGLQGRNCLGASPGFRTPRAAGEPGQANIGSTRGAQNTPCSGIISMSPCPAAHQDSWLWRELPSAM